MTWEVGLQTFTAGLAGIGVWFLWELVSEYRKFKDEASKNIAAMSKERNMIDIDLKATLLKIEELKGTSDLSIRSIHLELGSFKKSLSELIEQAGKTKEFMRQNYLLASVLHDKHDLLDKEMAKIRKEFNEWKDKVKVR